MTRRTLQIGATALAFFAILFEGLAGQDTDPQLLDRVMAVVGDSMVLRTQVDEELLRLQAQGMQIPNDPVAIAELRDQALQTLIQEYVLLQAALKDTTLIVDQARIETALEQNLQQIEQNFGSRSAMIEALRAEGRTLAQYREALRAQIRRQALIGQYIDKSTRNSGGIPVTESEMREVFDAQGGQLPQRPRTLSFSQVLISPEPSDSAMAAARREAERVFEEVRGATDDFETLARRYSDDPGSRQQGGDLGWFRQGQMVPEFEDAVFRMRPGQLSSVIQSEFGFHIILLERVRGAERKARHILIAPEVGAEDIARARTTAEEIRERAAAGESMSALHQEFGMVEQPDSLADVPVDQLGQFPPGYESALSGIREEDTLVGPIQFTQGGQQVFAVIKVTEVREGGQATYEDLQPQIRAFLQEQKARERLIQRLTESTYIQIRS